MKRGQLDSRCPAAVSNLAVSERERGFGVVEPAVDAVLRPLRIIEHRTVIVGGDIASNQHSVEMIREAVEQIVRANVQFQMIHGLIGHVEVGYRLQRRPCQ
jgi:hypothetical protein